MDTITSVRLHEGTFIQGVVLLVVTMCTRAMAERVLKFRRQLFYHNIIFLTVNRGLTPPQRFAQETGRNAELVEVGGARNALLCLDYVVMACVAVHCFAVRIAVASSLFHNSAASLLSGSSGLGADSSA